MSDQTKKGRAKMDWGAVASHRDAEPVEDHPTSGEGGQRARSATAGQPRTKPRRVVKYAATYRLPERALDLIDEAKAVAAESGERLSKEDAVAAAIEAHYGHLLPEVD